MKQKALQLQQTPEYWTTQIQLSLLKLIQDYLVENKMKRVEFAERIGVTKGYISQVMHGDYDHRISKMVELAMAVGFVPMIEFKPAEEVFNEDYRFEITNTPSNRNDNVGDCNYMSPCISINDTEGYAYAQCKGTKGTNLSA